MNLTALNNEATKNHKYNYKYLCIPPPHTRPHTRTSLHLPHASLTLRSFLASKIQFSQTKTHRFVKIQNDVTTVLFQTTYCTPRPTITTPRNGFKVWNIPTTQLLPYSPFEKTEMCNKQCSSLLFTFSVVFSALARYIVQSWTTSLPACPNQVRGLIMGARQCIAFTWVLPPVEGYHTKLEVHSITVSFFSDI